MVHAESAPADSVHFCAPFDYEQWRREHPRPAGKRLAALDAGEPRTVRMIYFLPNDRPYSAAVFGSVKTKMRQMHTFFANQMSAHGYGSEGFRFEKDAAGQPQVHRVNGQHPLSHYLENDTAGTILEEIDSTFDIESNIYFILIDTNGSGIRSGDRLVGGVGSAWTKKGGFALVPSESRPATDSHELGHAFGLHHDFRNNSYVMSYGFVPDWLFASGQLLSACNADFLAVHTYFNRQIPTNAGTLHTIEELTSSPIHTAGRTSVPVRIKTRDPDGLSQLMLLAQTKPPHFAEGFYEVKDCRGFDGQTDHTFEFDYDGVVPSLPESDFYSFRKQFLTVQALDALGNMVFSDRFELINNKFRSPIADFTVPIAEDGFISSMNFSPEGNLYAFQASYDDNNRLKLLNVSTGRSIASFPPRGQIEILAFSADNKRMALESDEHNIEVWDIENRRRLVTMEAQHERYERASSTISSLVFSPDGKLLASGGRNSPKVELWNALTGEHVTTVSTTHRGSIIALVFSDDGKFLASLGGGTIEVWNVVSKEPSHSIDAHGEGSWNSLSFSPDGKLLASGGFRTSFETYIQHSEIKLWDTATGSLVATLSGRGPVVFSPDGKFLASASASETRWVDIDGVEGGTQQGSTIGGSSVKLWDVATRQPVNSFPPLGHVDELDFSSDMRLLAESSSYLVRLWDLSEWIGEQAITTVEQAMPHTLTKVSGDEQEGTVGAALAKPFVVSVLDQNGSAFAGAVVTFSVTAGGGTLSATTATTDANGRARSTLTLGSDPGTNTVTATVEGLEPETFTAIGRATTDSDGEEEDINSPAVNVPDANLAAAVREELGLAPQASITQQAIQRLMALIIPNGQITDLTGLEHATGLVRLSLWDNQIEDVSPLAGLTQLQQLHIQANRIADITPLAGLTELRQLHLWGNQIRDIGVLAGLTKLESLWLAGNPIQDTSPLRTLLELNPNLDIDIEMALISESEETEPLADSEPSSEDQQGSEEQPTTAVELEGISASHDSVREDDEQATVITLTVTLDKAAAADETITLEIVSPTQGKTAKRDEDFDATLPETLTIAKGQRTGTAQLTLTPQDNTTADGDRAFAVQATSSSGHAALINIKIIDNDSASEPQAWLVPDPAEVEFYADDPAWKTFTVHTNLDSVLVRANPSGSDPAIEVAGGQQVPTRAYCPAEGNDRPTRGRRDGWSLHVKACQAGRTKILLIDYDTDAVVQQYEVNVEAYTSASATTRLNPSYPNPFNSETILSYTLPTASDIRLEVFTLNGQRVAVLHEGFQAAGYHTISIDASDWASGVYLYRLTTPEGRFAQKFTLLR